MLRRLLVVAGLGTALVLGARLALGEITARAWRARQAELTRLALPARTLRRPWEVRFEALAERVRSSPRVREIEGDFPLVARGAAPGRVLDARECLVIEALWNELAGLDPILAILRGEELPDGDGVGLQLGTAQVLADALCGRAWLALQDGEDARAAQAYADAMRLTLASEDGTSIGIATRLAAEHEVLRSVRSALSLGLSASLLEAELGTLLERRVYAPARAEAAIRRDLALVSEAPAEDCAWGEPASALAYFAPVEAALRLAHAPLARTPWAESADLRGASLAPAEARDDGAWHMATRALHDLHARSAVARVALAAAAWRERTGSYPATLAELGVPGSISIDPMTGGALAYRREGSGACIGPSAWSRVQDGYEDSEDSPYLWSLH